MSSYREKIENTLKRKLELQMSYQFESTHYMWMYRATSDEKYLDDEKKFFNQFPTFESYAKHYGLEQ